MSWPFPPKHTMHALTVALLVSPNLFRVVRTCMCFGTETDIGSVVEYSVKAYIMDRHEVVVKSGYEA